MGIVYRPNLYMEVGYFGCRETDYGDKFNNKNALVFSGYKCDIKTKAELAVKANASALVIINRDDTLRPFSIKGTN